MVMARVVGLMALTYVIQLYPKQSMKYLIAPYCGNMYMF